MTKKKSTTQPETETKVAKTKTQPVETKATTPTVKTPKAKTKAVTDTNPKPSKSRSKAKSDSATAVETKVAEQAITSADTENAPEGVKTPQEQGCQMTGVPDVVYEMDEGFDPPATATVESSSDEMPAFMKEKIERGEQIQPEDFFAPEPIDPMTDPVGAMQAVINDEEKNEDPTIKVKVGDEVVEVAKSRYVEVKTKDLIEFGYESLTEPEVASQLELILSGAERDDLDVVGQMMIGDFDFSHTTATIETVGGKIVSVSPKAGAILPTFDDDEDTAAENDAHRAAGDMIDNEKLLDAVWKQRDDLVEIRELTPREKEKLEYYEKQIADGMKKYISIGKYLFAIWSESLHQGEFTSWREYVVKKWKINATGSYDLMRAFRTWRLASSSETMSIGEAVSPDRWLIGETADDDGDVHDAEVVDNPNDVCVCGDRFKDHVEDKKGRLSCSKCACAEYSHDLDGKASGDEPEAKPAKKTEAKKAAPATSDADAPSQRAIEEIGKLTAKLDRGDLSDEDFAEFEQMAIRWLYQGLRDAVGEKDITQKTVAEAMDAFVEFAKTKAFEVDGEHYAAGDAASFRITRGLFESLQREKQSIREMLDARRKRMSESQERNNSEFSFVPPVDENGDVKTGTPELTLFCSHHGEQGVHIFMFGAVQLRCGAVFGKPKGQDAVLFNPKLTADNPIEGNELTH